MSDVHSNVVKFPVGISRKAYARNRRTTAREMAAEKIDSQIDSRPPDRTLSATAGNGRLRQERKEVWWMAEAATRYWKARIDFQSAVSWAQRMEIPEGRFHPNDPEESDRISMVGKYRAALVEQLLTPAWDTASVAWKRAALKSGQHVYTDVKPERIERAIADDLAFLAAHPVRRSNSEAMARSREFKEVMRQRIREIAASRDLSDEEIKPVLSLKHQRVAEFVDKHGVNFKWLYEGMGSIFKTGPKLLEVGNPATVVATMPEADQQAIRATVREILQECDQ
jgi:hypothetical protein